MSSVSSAASAYLWISIKSVDFCLKMWNTGGLGVALLRSFWGVLAVVAVLVVFCCIVLFRSAARFILLN